MFAHRRRMTGTALLTAAASYALLGLMEILCYHTTRSHRDARDLEQKAATGRNLRDLLFSATVTAAMTETGR